MCIRIQVVPGAHARTSELIHKRLSEYKKRSHVRNSLFEIFAKIHIFYFSSEDDSSPDEDSDELSSDELLSSEDEAWAKIKWIVL